MDDGRDSTELTLEPPTVVRSRRPRALWGALAALGLAAGALAVTSSGGDGGPPPKLPIGFGSPTVAAGGAQAADMMRAPVTYVAGPDLPLLGGEAPAYRLRGSVDEARVRALADALGLTGEITHDGPSWSLTSDSGTLGVYDGGAAQWWYSSTTVAGDGSVSSSGGGVACAEPAVDPDAAPKVGDPSEAVLCDPTAVTAIPECPPGTRCAVTTVLPPADLPSEDEARAKALDLLAATGQDLDGADVKVEGPYDAWFVTVEPRLEGLPTGLYASVSIGSEGVVTSAGGFLGVPERLGDYPVLDTHAAIDRANAQPAIDPTYRGGVEAQVGVAQATEGGGADGGVPADCQAAETCVTLMAGDCADGSTCTDPGMPVDGPVTTIVKCIAAADGTESCVPPELTCEEAMAANDVPVGAPDRTGCVAPDPVTDPLPEPVMEPLQVVLVDAVPSLVMLGAVDGSTDLYLVPGYRFEARDGGQVDLPAVADDALVAPPTTNSSAVTPIGPPVTDTTVPPADPCTIAVEQDQSSSTHTIQPAPDCVPLEPVPLAVGDQPEVGVGYYVDVNVMDAHCTFLSVQVGGTWWKADLPAGSLSTWSTPTEGGTFTLIDDGHAEFVGDSARTKVAVLVPNGDGTTQPGCT